MWRSSVLLLLLLATASSRAEGKVGQSCHTKGGAKGTCRQIAHCSKAMELIHNGIIPDICSFQGNSAIVCCEEKVGNIIVTVSSQKQKPYGGNLSVFRPSENIHEMAFTESPRKRTTISSEHSEVYIGSSSAESKPEDSNQRDNNDNYNLPGSLISGSKDISQRTKEEIEADNSNGILKKKKISEQMCEEYSKRATTTIIALPLLPRPDPVPITVQKCDFEKLPLIVGGEKAMAGEFPHMAAIGFRDGEDFAWNCGGSLISDNYVLTAAHCTHSSKGEPVMVRLGEHNLKSDNDGAQPVNYAIKEIIRRPDYNPPAKYNDIALLKLDRNVQFSKFIQPACLYTNDSFTVNKTVATGWGSIDYAEKPSDVLLKVALDIINNNDCNNLWHISPSQSNLAKGIVPSMMCAGVLTGGKDTCQGDSGGPIQITSKKNQCIYYVVGVTSFGKYCAARNTPGVYTRVSAYVPWIESIVWPQN